MIKLREFLNNFKYLKTTSHKLKKTKIYKSLEHRLGKKGLVYFKYGVMFFLALILLAYCSCLDNSHKKKAKPLIPVTPAKIRKGNIPVYLKSIGTVTPLQGVAVKTQINGRILKVNFQEGQKVTKDFVLIEIDPQPFEALLKQYEGQLRRDQALLDNARLDLKRYKTLFGQDSISEQTLDTQKYLVKQYEGTVQADQGLVDGAKVDLDYCRINATIEGIVGLRQVNPGNFVQITDATPLTFVNQLSPISVIFPLPEDDLVHILPHHENLKSLVVEAFDRKEEKVLATGHLEAMDSQINTSTGTINLRAVFDNKDTSLFPDQFVTIRLKVDTLTDTLIAPTSAVQMGAKGPYVYIINEKEKTVSAKSVHIQTTVGEESAVSGEITENQWVVTQGTDKLSEGAAVKPITNKGSPHK